MNKRISFWDNIIDYIESINMYISTTGHLIELNKY